MALSKQTAAAIVSVVSKDVESNTRINVNEGDSVLTRYVPESWGLKGDLRNVGFLLIGADPGTSEVANFVCVGISDATSTAITDALEYHAGLADVESAGTIDRAQPAEHTATLIVMKDGSRHVFDWHKSLNSTNPFISRASDWKKNRGAVPFTSFNGW